MKNETEIRELEARSRSSVGWLETRDRIHALHRKAISFEERGRLLKIFVDLMHVVEHADFVRDRKLFLQVLQSDYNLLLISESRDGARLNSRKLLAVTRREIAAGHISEEHELHKLALAQPPATPRQQFWQEWKSRLLKLGRR